LINPDLMFWPTDLWSKSYVLKQILSINFEIIVQRKKFLDSCRKYLNVVLVYHPTDLLVKLFIDDIHRLHLEIPGFGVGTQITTGHHQCFHQKSTVKCGWKQIYVVCRDQHYLCCCFKYTHISDRNGQYLLLEGKNYKKIIKGPNFVKCFF